METTAAAQTAGVTLKAVGRWIVDTASLACCLTLGRKEQPMKNLTAEFVEVVLDTAAHAADRYNKTALDKLLTDIKARDVPAIMADVDPAQVNLDDAAWHRLATTVSIQRGCVAADDWA